MNEEPSFTDEVVVILIDSEIVNGLLVFDRGDGGNAAPLAVDGEQAIADLHLPGRHPYAVLGVAAPDPERMPGTWPQQVVFALDTYLQQLVVVRRGERRDRLVFKLARGPVTRQNLVADLDRFYWRVAQI